MNQKNYSERLKKIGRNAPCPCGSGKKYKKCHLLKDEKAKRKERLAQEEAVNKAEEGQEENKEEVKEKNKKVNSVAPKVKLTKKQKLAHY